LLLNNNIFFSKKKIDLYKVFEIFWKQKIKIILTLFLFVTFFYFFGIIQSQKYITTVTISNIYSLENNSGIQSSPKISNIEPLDKRYELLKKIINNTVNEFSETNFFSLLDRNFNKKNSFEKFLKISHNFDKKLDVPELIVKKVPNIIELQFIHNDTDNKELVNKYIEYIFDLTFLEHKLQIEKNIKIFLVNENVIKDICINLEKSFIQSDACNLAKEQLNFNNKRIKALEKINLYRDIDPDFIYYNVFYFSPILINKKLELYITFGFLMGLFASGLLFFNLNVRRF
jgi:LPS O-antigen subunit length determinant protein (WzzB/FepE family)